MHADVCTHTSSQCKCWGPVQQILTCKVRLTYNTSNNYTMHLWYLLMAFICHFKNESRFELSLTARNWKYEQCPTSSKRDCSHCTPIFCTLAFMSKKLCLFSLWKQDIRLFSLSECTFIRHVLEQQVPLDKNFGGAEISRSQTDSVNPKTITTPLMWKTELK